MNYYRAMTKPPPDFKLILPFAFGLGLDRSFHWGFDSRFHLGLGRRFSRGLNRNFSRGLNRSFSRLYRGLGGGFNGRLRWSLGSALKRGFGVVFLGVAGRVNQAAAIFEFLAHALSDCNSVLQTVNADSGFRADHANAARFFAQHVDLLARHGLAIRFQHPCKLIG